MIDDGLQIIRKLWEAGLAHRDIKPANLLVRDLHLLLIDVLAFIELRPTPWRQAVDLANMMLCLALRSVRSWSTSGPGPVLGGGLPGFAAARGLACPPSSGACSEPGRDVHAEFLRLLPAPPRPNPDPTGLCAGSDSLAAMVLLLVLVSKRGLGVGYQEPVPATPTSVGNLACTDLEPQWLLAQSVPSASLVPCLHSLPAGWMMSNVTVNDGRSVIP